MFAVFLPLVAYEDECLKGSCLAGAWDMYMKKQLKLLMIGGLSAMLCSCDLSQIPGLDGKLSTEDSKAIGAACRHAGRALEDCFVLNPTGHQSGIFDGWKEMNDYMLSNQIEVVKPEIPVTVAQQTHEKTQQHEEKVEDKSAHGEKTPKKEAGVKAGADGAEGHGGAVSRPRWSPKSVGAESSNAEDGTSETPKSEKVVEKKPRLWERSKDKADHSNTKPQI
jgi:hypothetical protein